MAFQIVHPQNRPGAILREKRVVLGMTQQQVADKAGIKLQQYQKFESSERNIRTASFQLACKVIEALGMNPTDFFHYEYIIGEETAFDEDGKLRYIKTGTLTTEDVV